MCKFHVLACADVLLLKDGVNLIGEAEDISGQIAASSEEVPDWAGSKVLLNRLSFRPLGGKVSIRNSGLEWRQRHSKAAEGTLAAAHIDRVYDMRVSKVVLVLIWRITPLELMRVRR